MVDIQFFLLVYEHVIIDKCFLSSKVFDILG